MEISREINHVKKNSRKNKCIVGKKNVEKKSRRNKWIVENKSDVVKKKINQMEKKKIVKKNSLRGKNLTHVRIN